MRVVIDETRCIACGACEELCPQVFRIGDEVAEIVTQPGSECEACVREAAADCPQGAIVILDDEEGPG